MFEPETIETFLRVFTIVSIWVVIWHLLKLRRGE